MQQPLIIENRKRDFLKMCALAEVPSEKANMLCHCYINHIVYGSKYDANTQESIRALMRLMKIYDMKYTLGYETGVVLPE